MRSTWHLLLLVFILSFPLDLLSQQEFVISKPRLEVSDENLVIEYDIFNADETDKFTVWTEITNAAGFKINAKSLTGDVGEDVSDHRRGLRSSRHG